MIEFILNDKTIKTDLPVGLTLLDFVRYQKNLKGTKIGCREGDCGACTILVGELTGNRVEYRSMTSCLTPLANADSKHVVTVEGINPRNGELTPIQTALVDNCGTQCGFCTPGFVMSMTGFCIDETEKSDQMAVSAIDGNICRCTGYKSIEKAAKSLSEHIPDSGRGVKRLESAIKNDIVPKYFRDIRNRLEGLRETSNARVLKSSSGSRPVKFIVGGGTDLYVQKHGEMVYSDADHVFYDDDLRGVKEVEDSIEIGASATVTDLLESPIMRRLFPNLYKHLKLVSSSPIRNMATLAGNFVNASPIGDMTIWFLALDSEIVLVNRENPGKGQRTIALKDFYLGYKNLAKGENEFISAIRFKKQIGKFNFEKVSKRKNLDIATVNTALYLDAKDGIIIDAHLSAGGVSPIPLYLRKTSDFLVERKIDKETLSGAHKILQTEISPISDVRGSSNYKRLLLRQLFTAHFVELFGTQNGI